MQPPTSCLELLRLYSCHYLTVSLCCCTFSISTPRRMALNSGSATPHRNTSQKHQGTDTNASGHCNCGIAPISILISTPFGFPSRFLQHSPVLSSLLSLGPTNSTVPLHSCSHCCCCAELIDQGS